MLHNLSIVIPVWNNWNFTKSCLNDLVQLPPDTHEIVVVDNGSTDETPDGIKAFNINYVRLEENTGFSHACNEGYDKSNGEMVMFLNNDIRVKNNHNTWTKAITEGAADGSFVGPTGGLLDSSFNFIKEIDEYVDSKYYYMSGWNLTALRTTFEKLKLPEYAGPFSEEFGKAYFEDTDMSYRARELDIPFKIVNVPVHHFGKMTSKKLNMAALYLSAKQKFIAKWEGRIK